jgi:hypothetical protein
LNAGLLQRIDAAVWAGDQAILFELAPCRCCCEEHSFRSCPATVWHGCRGQFGDSNYPEQSDVESWVRVYAAAPHWMERREFFGGEG